MPCTTHPPKMPSARTLTTSISNANLTSSGITMMLPKAPPLSHSYILTAFAIERQVSPSSVLVHISTPVASVAGLIRPTARSTTPSSVAHLKRMTLLTSACVKTRTKNYTRVLHTRRCSDLFRVGRRSHRLHRAREPSWCIRILRGCSHTCYCGHSSARRWRKAPT
jgi:hypothetical protein